MAYAFRRLYPYRDADAAKAFYEIWVTRQVMRFARKLPAEVYRRLRGFLVTTADKGKIQNGEMYEHIDDDIYEFKYRTARLYSFTDGRRVVLTHGHYGPHLNRSVGERKVAAAVRSEYVLWKGHRK